MNREALFHIYWSVCLFILPLFLKIGLPVSARFPKDQFFVFAVAISIMVFGLDYKKISGKILWPCLALVFMAFFNMENFINHTTNYQFICFSAGMVLLLQMVSNLRKDFFHYIYISLGLVGLLQSVFVAASYFNVDLYQDAIRFITNAKTYVPSGERQTELVIKATGSMLNQNETGAVLASAMGVGFVYPWSLIFTGPAMVLTNSAMPLLAAMSATVFLVLNSIADHRHKIIIVGIFISLLGSMLYLKKGIDNGRFKQWKNVPEFVMRDAPIFKMAYHKRKGAFEVTYPKYEDTKWYIKAKHLIFGRGLGYFGWAYRMYFPTKPMFDKIHNEYLSLFIAFGLLGIGLVGYMLFAHLGLILSGERAMLFIFTCIAVNCFGHFIFHVSPSALIGIISLGALIRGERNGV